MLRQAEEADLAVAHLHAPARRPRRQAAGLTGRAAGLRSPASAPRRSRATSQTPAPAPSATSLAAAGAAGRAAAAHRLEEVAADGSSTITSLLLAEALPVGLEAAVELRELRVAAEGLGVDRRRLGIALALDLLRVAVGLGDDHLALAVGVGADLLALGGAGASAARWPRACARPPCGGRPIR